MIDSQRAELIGAIDRDGCTVVEGLLGADQVAAAAVALDEVFAAEADIAPARGWLTDTYRVAYALPVKHPVLLDVCTSPVVASVARAVLGEGCLLAGANGMDLVPGGPAQALHRDHPEPVPGTTVYLHVVMALDAFTADNGATRVVPGTHRPLPVGGTEPEPAEREGEAAALAVGAGGAVVLDGCLVHAAGANRSSAPRRALHLFFARWWAKPHWDLPSSFRSEQAEALSVEQRRLLGFGQRARRFDLDRRQIER